ncbi:MAG: hypothetical protein ABI193_23325 [Minicystis sp.]
MNRTPRLRLLPLLSIPLLTGCDPGITGLEPGSGTPHYVASSFPGTNLEIHGTRICDANTTVKFGGADPIPVESCTDSGTKALVHVQRLSSSGPITLSPGDGSGPYTSPSPFTVKTMRNQHGFKFPNYAGPRSLNVGDYAELFGADQFFIGADPCAWFGGSCSVRTPFPDPIAFIYVAATIEILRGKGECFGMVLGSQRLMRGDVPLSRFDGTARTVWQLDTTASPPSLPGLEHFLDLQHISQMSGNYLGAYLRGSAANAVLGAGAGAVVRARITTALSQSPPDFPMIALRKGGAGHLVLAYDVEEGTTSNGGVGDGDYFIYVYDPNQPFVAAEDTDPAVHLTSERDKSRIHVLTTNHWDFTGNFVDSPWGGDMSALVVTSYADIPMVHPILPSITDLVGTLLLAQGPVETTQVTDVDGHTLFNDKGEQEIQPGKAIPDSARAPFLTGFDSGETLLFAKPGVYRHTLRGKGKGELYSTMSVAQGFAAVAQAASGNQQKDDEVTFDTEKGGVTWKGGAAQKQMALQVLGRADDGSAHLGRMRIASSAGETESLSFDGKRQALVFQHLGADADLELVLGFSAEGDTPSTFASDMALPLKQGDLVQIAPTDWKKLNEAPVKILIEHKDGSQETMMLVQEAPISLLSGPDAKGHVSLRVNASSAGTADLQSVDVSCTGDPEAWTTIAMLSGEDRQTITADFDTHDQNAGCADLPDGERTLFVRVADVTGVYPMLAALKVGQK